MYKKKESINLFWELVIRNDDSCFEDYFTYDPLQTRIIEKAPEILENVLEKFCSPWEKQFLEFKFGLVDGKRLTFLQIENKLDIKCLLVEENYEECIEKLKAIFLPLNEFIFKDESDIHSDFTGNSNKQIIQKLIKKVGIISFIEMCIYENKNDNISFEFANKKEVNKKRLIKSILEKNISELDFDKRTYNKLMFHAVTVKDLINLINTKELKNIGGIGKKTYKEIVDRVSKVVPNFQDYDFLKITAENFDIKNGIYDKVLNDMEIDLMFPLGDNIERLEFFKKHNIFTVGQLIDAYNAEFPFITNEKQRNEIKHFVMISLKRFMKFDFNFV